MDHTLRPLAAIALVTLIGCAHRALPPLPPPPPAPVLPAAHGLRVTLTWGGPADLDLYLTGPSWETVYFGNTPAHSGGTLGHDAHCPDGPAAEPLVEWTSFAEPSPGRYRVGVDYSESCQNGGDRLPFRLVVEYGDARYEHTGLVRHHESMPIVLEFELRHTRPNGPLRLVTPEEAKHESRNRSEDQP